MSRGLGTPGARRPLRPDDRPSGTGGASRTAGRPARGLTGTVLDVGAGTGANLPHLRSASRVVAAGPDPAMRRRMVAKLAGARSRPRSPATPPRRCSSRTPASTPWCSPRCFARSATAMSSAPPQHPDIASAVSNDVARFGGLLAVAVLPALAGITGTSYLHPHALAAGFRTAALISGATCAAPGLRQWPRPHRSRRG
jgi:hypothetical protein